MGERPPRPTLKAGATPARELALDVLLDVERKDAYATLALDARLRRYEFSRRDAALATELVYGVLRHRGTLDWIISRAAGRPVKATDRLSRNIVRLALYQALFLNSIPGPVAVDQAVQSSKRRGAGRAAGFVNAVLRRAAARSLESWAAEFPPIESDPVGHIAVSTSHPHWMVDRWVRRLGVEETRALCAANNERPSTSVRVNTLRTTPEKLLASLAESGVTARRSDWLPEVLVIENAGSVAESDVFRRGLFIVQDEAAALVARTVDPKPGERIVDLAAAPGGKSTHLAELSGDRADILSVELHRGKARLIEHNVARMGITSVRIEVADIRDLTGRYAGWADRVLLDAPCSGLGLVRKKPDIRWRRKPSDISALAAVQSDLLRAAAALVRPGGVLVYSTCTTEPEENENVVRRFTDENEAFRIESVSDVLLPSAARRLAADTGPQADVGIYLYPHRHGTDGFYICRMRKT